MSKITDLRKIPDQDGAVVHLVLKFMIKRAVKIGGLSKEFSRLLKQTAKQSGKIMTQITIKQPGIDGIRWNFLPWRNLFSIIENNLEN